MIRSPPSIDGRTKSAYSAALRLRIRTSKLKTHFLFRGA